MNKKWLRKRVERIVALGDDIQLYSEYAEPGYSDPKSGFIAVANWNRKTRYIPEKNEFETTDDTMPRIAKLLEKLGVELEWCDEWCSCAGCNGLLRISPDSYGWQPAYSPDDHGYWCMQCVRPKDHLASCVERGKGNEISQIDPSKHGYVLIADELEHGWHGGQRASPDLVLKSMNKAGVLGVLLNLDSVGQFDMSFSVYVLKKLGKKNIAKAHEVMRMPSKINLKEDPATTLSRGLKAASEATAKLPDGPGVKVTTVNPDGTATARLVGPEEFVTKGIR